MSPFLNSFLGILIEDLLGALHSAFDPTSKGGPFAAEPRTPGEG